MTFLDISPTLLDGLVTAKSVTTYNAVAATAFILYDYLLTFGEEVELIWRAKLSCITIVFYWIRYLTFCIRIVHLIFCSSLFFQVSISKAGCLTLQWIQVMSGQTLFLAVEILLITRVFAYYGRNKFLLVCLLILLAGEISAMITLVATTLPQSRAILNPSPSSIHVASCLGFETPTRFSGLWIPPLIMQSILSILIPRQFIKNRVDAQIYNPPFLVVFMRDNAWALLLLFAMSLWANLSYELTEHQEGIALTWSYSILGFCGSRLILNLRTAAHDGDRNDSTHYLSDAIFPTIPHSTVSRGAFSVTAEA